MSLKCSARIILFKAFFDLAGLTVKPGQGIPIKSKENVVKYNEFMLQTGDSFFFYILPLLHYTVKFLTFFNVEFCRDFIPCKSLQPHKCQNNPFF